MKKIFLIILIIILILFIGGLSYYKFVMNKDKKEDIYKKYTIKEEKKEDSNAVKDNVTYSTSIINENIKSYNYDLIKEDNSVVGRIYINDKGLLYISNGMKVFKISDAKFKTLYRNDEIEGILSLYAISNDGKIYYIYLNDLDITKIVINPINTNFEVSNFTTLKLKDPYSFFNTNIIVLSKDGNMYEPRSSIRYKDTLISFMGQYYVFEDNSIANLYGNLLKYDKEEYKIKYYLTFPEGKSPFENTNSIIITKNNKIIYCIENSNNLYVYNKTIKDLKYEISKKEYNTVSVNITFTDDSIMKFNAQYTQYYGF